MPSIKSTKAEKSEQSELDAILCEIHISERSVTKLVTELEGTITSHSQLSLDFAKAYTILLLKTYCKSPDDCELMLATYGLLKGFEFKKKQYSVRIKKYYKYSKDYNKIFADTNTLSTAIRNALKARNSIISYLDESLSARKLSNGGTLGLIEDVSKKLCLPELHEVYNDIQDNDNKPTGDRDELGDTDKPAVNRNKKGNTAPKVKFIVKHIKEELTFKECIKKYWMRCTIIALLLFGTGFGIGWIAKDIFSSLNTGVPAPEPTNGSIENPVNTSNNGDNIIINNYGTINYSDFFDNE